MNDDSALEINRPEREADATAPTPDDDDRTMQTATVDAPERRVRRVRGKRRRRRRRLARIRRALLPIALIVVLMFAIVGVWAGTRALAAWHAYQATRTDIDRLQAQRTLDPSTASPADLAKLQTNFQDLSFDLQRLDSVLTMTGAQPILGHLPWAAPRYHAAQQLLTIGELLADAGASGAGIAQETLTAFQQDGVMSNGTTTSPTWLDVVTQHQADIQRIAQQVSQAQQLRASLDTAMLPGSARARLGDLDQWLNKYDVQPLVNQDLPAIQTALGAEKDVRYLVLFQNPEELRPAGGFPGTIALVTISHGQVKSYDFSDVQALTDDYVAHRTSKRPQPWPIQQYFPQDGFLIQDATWFADFPKSGATVMSMYAETDWPAIDGVIAVEPAAVSAVLKVIGPVTVEVDGEPRTITADNVLDEVERQRRLRREGLPAQLKHKQVLELIGDEIINHVKQGNRGELRQIARGLEDSANRRDIQAYSPDPQVEALLDDRVWSGRLIPDPNVPTLAVTFANLVLVKDSLRMQPLLDLQIGPVQDGRREAALTITLKNTGTNAEDPFYAGFQKWWVQVDLPQGSTRTSSDPASLPDPDASNGGSYKIDLFPQQTGKITVTFTMPASESLVIRRQPGLSPATVTLAEGTCQNPEALRLAADASADLTALCK